MPEQVIEIGAIEVATSEEDGYSDYSSGVESDLTSLASSVKNHVYENGRRFHGYKQDSIRYYLPNDEPEQDRMDIAHHYHLLALKGDLYTAPIKGKNIQHILDVGTGTGIWAIDIGDEFPGAKVTGVDLSPIQPKYVPPNVTFEVDDISEEWTWPENSFDYIHLRSLACFIDEDHWEHIVQQAYRALKPGGYIELQDLTDFFQSDDDSVPATSALVRSVNYAQECVKRLGKPWYEVPELFKGLLRKHGYEGIHEMSVKCPIGPWAKDKGLQNMGNYGRIMKHHGAESLMLAMFTKVLGWDMQRLGSFIEEFKHDLLNRNMHPTERFYNIYAQKPMA